MIQNVILLSNTIGSAKQSVAEVRQMASLRGGDGDYDERVSEWQPSLPAKASGLNL